MNMQPFSVVVADRGYCDYALLNHWDSNHVFFVVRHKDNIRYIGIKERPLPEKRAQDVLIDEVVEPELPAARAKYPKRLRRIAVWNEEHQYVVEILTNNFSLAASTIAALYKARWEIEIFFSESQTTAAHKKFHRDNTQCRRNTDMDGLDDHAAFYVGSNALPNTNGPWQTLSSRSGSIRSPKSTSSNGLMSLLRLHRTTQSCHWGIKT